MPERSRLDMLQASEAAARQGPDPGLAHLGPPRCTMRTRVARAREAIGMGLALLGVILGGWGMLLLVIYFILEVLP